jgi:uncharacterized protein (DUF488 family)
MATVYSMGHSTREMAEFSRILEVHEIRMLEDIRAFPASRRHPQFNRENMEAWLPQAGCGYRWEKDLGGKRGRQMPPELSPHIALRDEAFRNYADYMLSPQFQKAAGRLVERAAEQRTAILCAEALYSNCHRMLVSDYLLSQGHTVLHILDEGPPKEHGLSRDARIIEEKLIYRGDRLL